MKWEREEAHKLPIPGNDGRSFGLREENNSRMQTTQAGRSLHVLQGALGDYKNEHRESEGGDTHRREALEQGPGSAAAWGSPGFGDTLTRRDTEGRGAHSPLLLVK